MSTPIGFHCPHEQHAPSTLLRLVQRAEAAGFPAAMCSDHFYPWSEAQGHSGYSWSWLGAALQSTQISFGTVCAPGQRYHPAIVAQAVATICEMYPGRFWLALGSGEALNERITGAPWPSKEQRQIRLKECADIMRALWAGETVTHDGAVTVSKARLYTRPPQPPLLLAAALTPETARWAGAWADGLITVSGQRERMRELLEAFRERGGDDKPVFLQVALAFGETDGESERIAYEQWKHAGLSPSDLANVETPWELDGTGHLIPQERVLTAVRASADVERHLEWLREDLAMGYTRVYLHNVHTDYRRFFEEFAGRVTTL